MARRAVGIITVSMLVGALSLFVVPVAGATTNVFSDDLESGSTKWVTGGDLFPTWGVATDSTGNSFLTDTPEGGYSIGTDSWARTSSALVLTDLQQCSVAYRVSLDTEAGSDHLRVEASGNGGTTWQILDSYSGSTSSMWQDKVTDLSLFDDQPSVHLRFHLVADGYDDGYHDGVQVDDVSVSCEPEATVSPSPSPTTSTPPPAGTGGGKIVFGSNRDGNFEIYIMDADGSDQTNLTDSPSSEDEDPVLSPDGRKIAFASNRSNSGSYDIWTMNIDGSGLRGLQGGKDPAWSPDGKMIAYETGAGIYVMNRDGSAPRQVTTGGVFDSSPAWSPDGTRIAFDRQMTGEDWQHEIFTVAPNGSGLTRLTNGIHDNTHPVFSPDGTRIVYASNEVPAGAIQQDGIWVMNASGTGKLQLSSQGAGLPEGSPSWSPDGASIVFVTNRDADEEIYAMDANGANVRRLTNARGFDEDPSWSVTCTSACITIDPTPSETEIFTIKKRATKVKVLGAVSPAHEGLPVVVQLAKKKSGRFRAVAKKTTSLFATSYPDISGFITAFPRPSAGTCRVTATFVGDDDHLASKARKTFSC